MKRTLLFPLVIYVFASSTSNFGADNQFQEYITYLDALVEHLTQLKENLVKFSDNHAHVDVRTAFAGKASNTYNFEATGVLAKAMAYQSLYETLLKTGDSSQLIQNFLLAYQTRAFLEEFRQQQIRKLCESTKDRQSPQSSSAEQIRKIRYNNIMGKMYRKHEEPFNKYYANNLHFLAKVALANQKKKGTEKPLRIKRPTDEILTIQKNYAKQRRTLLTTAKYIKPHQGQIQSRSQEPHKEKRPYNKSNRKLFNQRSR